MTEILKSSENSEKSEDELDYENRERQLLDELYITSNQNAKYILKAGDEYSKIYEKAGRDDADAVKEAFSALSSSTKNTSRATLETLINYIDTKFPSPYKREENPFVEEFLNERTSENSDENPEEMAEYEYRRAASRQGEVENDGILEIAKLVSVGGNKDDFFIANSLRHLAEGTADYDTNFAKNLISYVNDPNPNTRQHLVHTQGDHEGVLTNSLFNIAATFDNMNTPLSDRLFEPTIALATMATRGSEELFGGIMNYLKFKMETPLEKSKK